MGLAVKDDGTQAATPSTEHDLVDTSDAGIYTSWVDVAALQGDEVVELRVYAPVVSGGTERLVEQSEFGSGLDTPIVRSVAYDLPFGGRFTLKQVGGSSRSFPWSVHQLDA